jgi:hypothetical protein
MWPWVEFQLQADQNRKKPLDTVPVHSRVHPREFLAQVRALRERMPRLHINDKQLRAARKH